MFLGLRWLLFSRTGYTWAIYYNAEIVFHGAVIKKQKLALAHELSTSNTRNIIIIFYKMMKLVYKKTLKIISGFSRCFTYFQ